MRRPLHEQARQAVGWCWAITSGAVRKNRYFVNEFTSTLAAREAHRRFHRPKRGLGYSVPELSTSLREILGLGRGWRVVIIGAGKIGAALAQYRGFRQRGFQIVAAYDSNPEKIGGTLEGIEIRDMHRFEADVEKDHPEIAVLAVPMEHAQAVLDRVARAGIKAVLNFAPVQLHAPADMTVKTVNMAMELEGLTFALTNQGA